MSLLIRHSITPKFGASSVPSSLVVPMTSRGPLHVSTRALSLIPMRPVPPTATKAKKRACLRSLYGKQLHTMTPPISQAMLYWQVRDRTPLGTAIEKVSSALGGDEVIECQPGQRAIESQREDKLGLVAERWTVSFFWATSHWDMGAFWSSMCFWNGDMMCQHYDGRLFSVTSEATHQLADNGWSRLAFASCKSPQGERLIVAEQKQNHRRLVSMRRLSNNKLKIETLTEFSHAARQICVDDRSRVYILDGTCLNVYDGANFTRTIPVPHTILPQVILGPSAVAAWQDKIYTVEHNIIHKPRVQVLSKDGDIIGTLGAGRLRAPRDVCVDTEGRVFVADSEAKALFVFDRDGNCLHELGTEEFSNPWHVAVDRSGRIAVGDCPLGQGSVVFYQMNKDGSMQHFDSRMIHHV